MAPDASSATSGGADEGEQFPESIFGDLSGTVGYMDASGGTVAQAKDDTVWKNFTDVTGVDLKQEFQADTASSWRWPRQEGTCRWTSLRSRPWRTSRF